MRQLTAVSVRVRADDGAMLINRTFELIGDSMSPLLSQDLVLRARSATSRGVHIEVDALTGMGAHTVLFTSMADTTFTPNALRMIVVNLEQQCAATPPPMCGQGLTCGAGMMGCEPIQRQTVEYTSPGDGGMPPGPDGSMDVPSLVDVPIVPDVPDVIVSPDAGVCARLWNMPAATTGMSSQVAIQYNPTADKYMMVWTETTGQSVGIYGWFLNGGGGVSTGAEVNHPTLGTVPITIATTSVGGVKDLSIRTFDTGFLVGWIDSQPLRSLAKLRYIAVSPTGQMSGTNADMAEVVVETLGPANPHFRFASDPPRWDTMMGSPTARLILWTSDSMGSKMEVRSWTMGTTTIANPQAISASSTGLPVPLRIDTLTPTGGPPPIEFLGLNTLTPGVLPISQFTFNPTNLTYMSTGSNLSLSFMTTDAIDPKTVNGVRNQSQQNWFGVGATMNKLFLANGPAVTTAVLPTVPVLLDQIAISASNQDPRIAWRDTNDDVWMGAINGQSLTGATMINLKSRSNVALAEPSSRAQPSFSALAFVSTSNRPVITRLETGTPCP